MNIKHGFYSKNSFINPDMRLMQNYELTIDDLAYAEKFLFGDTCADPIRAHNIVKLVYQAGRRKYPTLWKKADRYVHGGKYETMEKICSLPDKSL